MKATDRDDILRLCRSRDYPRSAFATQEESKQLALDSLEPTLQALSQKQDIFGLVAYNERQISAYMFGQASQKDSLTDEPQTKILELVAPCQSDFDALISGAAERAKEGKDAYLVYHTFESQSSEMDWAKAQGFKTELLRSYMKVSAEEEIPSHPDYKLRRAKKSEIPFLVQLVQQHCPSYIPAHRTVDIAQLRREYSVLYRGLPINDKKKVPLVLVRRSSEVLMGYVILQPGRLFGDRGPAGMYVYDVAIGPAGHGLGLSRWIALGTRELMKKMGGGVIYGDISPLNRLSLGANLALGGRIDSRRWGLKLVNRD